MSEDTSTALDPRLYLTDVCKAGEGYWCWQCTGCEHACHAMPIEAARELQSRQGVRRELPYCAHCGVPIVKKNADWIHAAEPCEQQAKPTAI